MTSVRDKARFKVPASRARNPLVAAALLRTNAGAHRKTEKALRRAAQAQIKKLPNSQD